MSTSTQSRNEPAAVPSGRSIRIGDAMNIRQGLRRRRNSPWCSKPLISDRFGPRTLKSPSNTAVCVTPISRLVKRRVSGADVR